MRGETAARHPHHRCSSTQSTLRNPATKVVSGVTSVVVRHARGV
ncbi:MAG TPA: hypothetical protein VK324_01910 [Tepidisphaeraceae bacterium]|nr:hypothetical protein [Tepidisphaeraceae bacterium]